MDCAGVWCHSSLQRNMTARWPARQRVARLSSGVGLLCGLAQNMIVHAGQANMVARQPLVWKSVACHVRTEGNRCLFFRCSWGRKVRVNYYEQPWEYCNWAGGSSGYGAKCRIWGEICAFGATFQKLRLHTHQKPAISSTFSMGVRQLPVANKDGTMSQTSF